jgi:hypothetical protein
VDEAVKAPKEPLVTVISATAKSLVASLLVKVSARVASLDVNPSDPSLAAKVNQNVLLKAKNIQKDFLLFPLHVMNYKKIVY